MSLTDTTYGWDVSNYQAALTEQHFRSAKNEGIEFSIALATDGTGFQNFMFSRQLDWGRKVGMLTASYHYVRDTSISQQIANIKRTVPLDCPVIPDAEHGSGGINVLDNVIAALLSEGYTVPLEYLPRWYWQIIGSPWLGGRPRPLWASWYPDYVRRSKELGAAMLPGSVWSGYGGQTVAITQFTSSGIAGGYPHELDLNKFRGTKNELAALLQGDDMGWNDILTNPENGFQAEAGDFLTLTNDKVTQLVEGAIPVEGEDRTTNLVTEIGWLPKNFKMIKAQLAALIELVAADRDITPEDLVSSVDEAVKRHTPTAEQIATAQERTLLPIVQAALKQVRDTDNTDEAKKTVDELLKRIGSLLGTAPAPIIEGEE